MLVALFSDTVLFKVVNQIVYNFMAVSVLTNKIVSSVQLIKFNRKVE